MRKRTKIFLLLGFFLFGCEQSPYQLRKSEDGTIYRLNKKTGEVAIIKDNKVMPVENSELKSIKKGDKQVIGKSTIESSKTLIDKTKFDSIYRTTKEIEGAIKIGVSYNDFIKLIQKLSTDIEIAKDKISTNGEQDLLLLYEVVLNCYKDSLTLWKAMIEHDVDKPSKMDYADMEALLALQPILAQYGIELKIDERLSKFMNFTFYIIPKNSLQLIWGEAEKRVNEPNEILKRYK